MGQTVRKTATFQALEAVNLEVPTPPVGQTGLGQSAGQWVRGGRGPPSEGDIYRTAGTSDKVRALGHVVSDCGVAPLCTLTLS